MFENSSPSPELPPLPYATQTWTYLCATGATVAQATEKQLLYGDRVLSSCSSLNFIRRVAVVDDRTMVIVLI